MSASATMEVATTTAITQMEVTHVPAMMATVLTVMDTHVKVGQVEKKMLTVKTWICELWTGILTYINCTLVLTFTVI